MSSSNLPIQNITPPSSTEFVTARQSPSSSDNLVSRVPRQPKNGGPRNRSKQTRLENRGERKQRSGGRYRPSSALCDTVGLGTYHRSGSSTFYRDPGSFHKFSKQQFLQANCQFVVLDGHDYSIHKADPDWPVDWNCIEEVRFKQCASTETTCPICLEFPVAAKITRCGHIYCWTCMLHYLSLSDENCRQCPICFEAVYKNDLRSVVSHSFSNYSLGEEIVMKLMIRRKGCVEVEPFGSYESKESSDSNFEHQNSHFWSQANLVIVDSSNVISTTAERERNELLVKLELDKDQPEVCFVEQALNGLEKRVKWLSTRTVSNTASSKLTSQSNQDRQDSPSLKSENLKNYLFYQCTDNQHIYLNPFCTKILCHEYGSLENCPREIRAKILQMDWISMNESWRKRFKYLEHLPLTCEFRLIEIDFENSNLITHETYEFFGDQIKRREKEREIRRREERKREKLIQVEQNRKIYGIQPSLKINLDNIDQFPSVSDERYLGLTQLRNKNRTYEEILSSEEEEVIGNRLTNVNTNPPLEPIESSSQLPVEGQDQTVSAVALSFKDIQLQEEALALKSSKTQNNSGNSSNHWNTGNKQPSHSAQSSSFAQLLVNAKKSQKVWTRTVSSVSGANNPSIPSSKSRPCVASGSEDGEEESRAPPFEFTLNDFIDLNSASTSGKKKGKTKMANKKG